MSVPVAEKAVFKHALLVGLIIVERTEIMFQLFLLKYMLPSILIIEIGYTRHLWPLNRLPGPKSAQNLYVNRRTDYWYPRLVPKPNQWTVVETRNVHNVA